jgi:hypothetical protein
MFLDFAFLDPLFAASPRQVRHGNEKGPARSKLIAVDPDLAKSGRDSPKPTCRQHLALAGLSAMTTPWEAHGTAMGGQSERFVPWAAV